MRIFIDYPPTKAGKNAWNKRFGLNAYYAGKHYQQRKRDAEELHWLAAAAMKRARIRREMVRGPVEVRFCWDDGLDVDNHAVLGKAFLDAMKGCILPDDNRRWVKRVTHEFWDGGRILVEVLPWKGDQNENEKDRAGVPAPAAGEHAGARGKRR